MTILWTSPATADLATIRSYIAASNPSAANEMVRRIVNLVEKQLPSMPASGRNGRLSKTRELVVAATPYFVVYRVNDTVIEVLRVIHGARRWPESI